MTESKSTSRKIPPFLAGYLRYLAVNRNYCESSCATAMYQLREFLQFIHYRTLFQRSPESDEHRDLDISNMAVSEAAAVTNADIELYLAFSDGVSKTRRNTLCKSLGILRRFYTYLCTNAAEFGIDSFDNPARGILVAAPKAAPTLIPQKDIDRFLSGITGENEVRDRAMAILFLTTGLTLSELAGLDFGDYHKTYITVRGKRERSVYLTTPCQEAMALYLTQYRTPYLHENGESALFISQRSGRRLGVRAIQKTIHNQLVAAGLEEKGYSIQDLRDTAVKMMLDAIDSDIEREMLARYLGYTSTYMSIRHGTGSAQAARHFGALLDQSPVGQLGATKGGKI